MENAKRYKQDESIVLRINSAHFQALMFAETGESFNEALAFAQKCNMKIDNRKLYGASDENAKAKVFFSWTKITPCFTDTKIRALFNVLISTNAHQVSKIKQIYDYITQVNVRPEILKCLLSRLDIFPVSHALRFLGGHMPQKQHYNLFLQTIELSLASSCPYTALNQALQGGQNCLNAMDAIINLGCTQRLQDLLHLIPIVDLDFFYDKKKCGSRFVQGKKCATHRWYSIEEWATQNSGKNFAMDAIIREGRNILEEYRTKRAQIVLRTLQSSNMPHAVSSIINLYGERPPIRPTITSV